MGEDVTQKEEIWKKVLFVELIMGGHTCFPTQTDTWMQIRGCMEGAMWPGWILTLPAQHQNLQSKAIRIDKTSTTPLL